MNEEIRACRCTDFWAFHHPDCPAMQTIRRLRAELAECKRDAERYRWVRQRLEVRMMANMRGGSATALATRVGHAYFHSSVSPAPIKAERLDAAIDAALAAEGGVMEDDQTDPEMVLLVLMERAFKGPTHEGVRILDWAPQLKRVLQCVRENDPVYGVLRDDIERLRAELEASETELRIVRASQAESNAEVERLRAALEQIPIATSEPNIQQIPIATSEPNIQQIPIATSEPNIQQIPIATSEPNIQQMCENALRNEN